MAADLFKADPAFRNLVQRASERTGSDLEKICLRGPERELTRTKNLQPLLVCVSLGYLRHLDGQGNSAGQSPRPFARRNFRAGGGGHCQF